MPTPGYAVMPSVAVADIQPIARFVVAIIGLVTTLVAGAYAQNREARSERARSLRDRRTDVYLASPTPSTKVRSMPMISKRLCA